jgi:Putative zinc-finger
MGCVEARRHLLDDRRGQLSPERHRDLRAHVGTCAACGRAELAEEALTDLLEPRLPQHPASLSLKRRLAAQWPAPVDPRRAWWPRRWRSIAPAVAVASVPLAAIPPAYRQRRWRAPDSAGRGPVAVENAEAQRPARE